MEHFFGDFKHNLRKRIGNAGLKRYIHLLHPEAQLAQNLLNEEYLNIIGDCDLETICKMFAAAEKDAKNRAGSRKEFNNRPSHIPLKILRSNTFLDNIKYTLSYVFDILFQAGQHISQDFQLYTLKSGATKLNRFAIYEGLLIVINLRLQFRLEVRIQKINQVYLELSVRIAL